MLLSKLKRFSLFKKSSFFNIFCVKERKHEILCTEKRSGEYVGLYEELSGYQKKFCQWMTINTFDYILKGIEQDLSRAETNFHKELMSFWKIVPK